MKEGRFEAWERRSSLFENMLESSWEQLTRYSVQSSCLDSFFSAFLTCARLSWRWETLESAISVLTWERLFHPAFFARELISLTSVKDWKQTMMKIWFVFVSQLFVACTARLQDYYLKWESSSRANSLVFSLRVTFRKICFQLKKFIV